MEQVYTPKKDYKVLVSCMTYNQSKYIEDALNGFAMQKTDFPFVCLVMDDASTDGEQDVIKAWMERECDMEKAENVEIEKSFITIVPHKSNGNCTFVCYFLKENLYRTGKKTPLITPWREHCEYEALCEGDDYWISSEKLQTQVEFLDGHEDYSMCFHNAKVVGDDVQVDSDMYSHLENSDYSGVEILLKWTVPTASVLYRKESILQLPRDARFIHGDIVLFLTMASMGKLRCIDKPMSVYRRNSNGVSISDMKRINIQRIIGHFDAILEHFGNQYYDVVVERKASWCVARFINGKFGAPSIQSIRCAISDKKVFYLFLHKLPKSVFSAIKTKIQKGNKL